MKLINIILIASILMLLTGSGLAYTSGRIEMRTGANITLDDGYVLGALNATTAQGLVTLSQKGYTTVTDFGAKGDGATDDTSALQAGFDVGGTIYVPTGIYRINPSTGLYARNNSTIIFAKGAVIKNLPESLTTYRMIYMYRVHNVVLLSPTLDGNRAQHTGTTGEWGYGIDIVASKDIYIYNADISNTWGDGIDISNFIAPSTEIVSHGNENVNIYSPVIRNCRRQGISLSDSNGTLIKDAVIENINGTAPGYAIDIEPSVSEENLSGIRIIGLQSKNNNGGAILIVPNNLVGTGKDIDIYISNVFDYGPCGVPFRFIGAGAGSINGSIILENVNSYNAPYRAFTIQNWPITYPQIYIKNPTIINGNSVGSSDVTKSSTFLLIGYAWDSGDVSIGNVWIKNPTIRNTNGKNPVSLLFVYDYRGIGSSQIYFLDPLEVPSVNTVAPFYVYGSVNISDRYGKMVYSLSNTNDVASIASFRPTCISDKFTADRTYAIQELGVNTELTFIVGSAHYLTIDTDGSDQILPLGSGAGKYIKCNAPGSRISLKKVDSNTWYVTGMVGTWTAE